MEKFLNYMFDQYPVMAGYIMTYPFIIGVFYLITTFAL